MTPDDSRATTPAGSHAGNAHPPDSLGRFGDYEVCRREDGSVHELGRGAMGVTYRAHDTVLDRAVALKVIARGVAIEPGTRERFLREARAAAQLRHANVAAIYHYGVRPEDGECFYAMELVDGETLETKMREHGPLLLPLALSIAVQVARALVAAEASGLVHRDLKPANLMLVKAPGHAGDEDELAVKVIDFGLAKATSGRPIDLSETQEGLFSGTPAFASPEQVGGGRLDVRSDIYALGVTLWFMLSAKLPFAGLNLAEICRRQLHDPLPVEQLAESGISESVLELLGAMLAPSPEDRPQTARELLVALESCRADLGRKPRRWRRWRPRQKRRRDRFIAVGLILAAIGGLAGWLSTHPRVAGPNLNPAEKSVAVLPFQNLSDEKENTFFAEGVQDDVQTRLAKIGDLKVIGRASVQAYRAGAHSQLDLREIGRALGVTHLVEGSVRRWGDRVVISVDVIDVGQNRQIWAERYERGLADVFSIQDEIAAQIVSQLKAKLLPAEKAAISEQPTTDLAAYDLYLRAKELFGTFFVATEPRETLLQTVRFLNEAVERDPNFVLAYCRLAEMHDMLHWTGADRTPARLALAEAAIDSATRLRPELGDVHLARATHLYLGPREFAASRAELLLAAETLPNSAPLFQRLGLIDRRQGRWDEAIRNLEKAAVLDPRNLRVVRDLFLTYRFCRRWDDARRVLERASTAKLTAESLALDQADLAYQSRGDRETLEQTLQSLPPNYDPSFHVSLNRWLLAWQKRDYVEATRVLEAFPAKEISDPNLFVYPRAWFEGRLARVLGGQTRAEIALLAAREAAEEMIRTEPTAPKPIAVLAQIDATLGRKEEALRGAERAVAMVPLAKDAIDGPELLDALARVCAQVGETDRALEALESLLKIPGDLAYGPLLHDPVWDSLRAEPRFAKLLDSQRPVQKL